MKSSVIPKKSLGQNFLVNPRILDKITAASEISKEDIVLEVGPGTGNLTKKLADKAKKVIAIEKDRRLISLLKENLKDYKNLEVIEADILKFRVDDLRLRTGEYKIVGNIPYYITSRFLRKALEEWPCPKLVILTIQKEVARRITAEPPKMNLLAVSVQFFSEPKIISYISKENFRPRPKVDSAIIKLAPKSQNPNIDAEKFFKIVRAGFSQKRKMLVSNLSKKFGIMKEEVLEIFAKVNIQPKLRAENLSLNKWMELVVYFRNLPT